MTTLRAFAAAKVNLDLRIVGRRDDGYHFLESVVAFASVGDRLEVAQATPDGGGRIEAVGPTAAMLDTGPTSLTRAVAALAAEAGLPLSALSVDVQLEKVLPVAAGLGGGSADAAALIGALDRLFGLDLAPTRLARAALAVGADVPACLLGAPLWMTGIGEAITPLPRWPTVDAVLVNPSVPCPTPAVFAAFAGSGAPFAPSRPPPSQVDDFETATTWLARSANDLEPAAVKLAPAIGDVLARLRAAPGLIFARMTGSGATCYGLFDDASAARAAAARIAAAAPSWWVASCRLGPAVDAAAGDHVRGAADTAPAMASAGAAATGGGG